MEFCITGIMVCACTYDGNITSSLMPIVRKGLVCLFDHLYNVPI